MVPRFNCHEPSGNLWHPPSAKQCDNCGNPANIPCPSCPSTERTYYCSARCRSRDTRAHHTFCLSKQMYARVRDIYFTPDSFMETLDLMQIIIQGLELETSHLLMSYLGTVPCEKRPVRMINDDEPDKWMGETAAELAQRTTKKKHNKRVLPLWETRYRKSHPRDVPFTDRPYEEDVLDDEGDGVSGIEVFATDYEIISMELFNEMFDVENGKKRVWVDPWST